MPTVNLKKDQHDEHMILIYSVFDSAVGGYRTRNWVLSGTMHIDDVDGVFGTNIAWKVKEQDQIDVDVTAEIKRNEE